MKKWLIILSLGWMFVSIQSVCFAQATSQATKSEEETLDIPKSRKFIYLTLGIEYDEKLTNVPEVITFQKGDYKKITEVAFSKANQSLHFVPRKEGIATLIVLDKNHKRIAEYHLIVRKSRLDAVAREIQSLLGDVEGITVKILNNKVIVDGQVLLQSDMARVLNVIGQFSDATSLVTMSPLALKKIADFIARDINNPEIEVKALNDRIILSGFANTDDDKTSYEKIAQFYMPQPLAETGAAKDAFANKRRPANDGIVNLIKVKPAQPMPPPKMIQVVLHYVELAKDYSKSFRFQFMPNVDDGSGIQFQAGDSGSGSTSTFTATINSLIPKLNWLKSHGHARSLESGTILVQDGKQGTFGSNNKYPVSTTTGTAGQTQTSTPDVGILTKVTPTLTGERSDSVDLDINFRISAPNGTSSAGIIVAQNDITTSITVRSTQSAAIAGLISNNTSTGYNRLPSGVSSNPIISLYASKDFSRGQSQFVVFVTPIIRNSASVGAEKLKKKFRLRE